MKELEIRTNGEVLQANMPVGQITFLRPFIEGELAGLWFPDGWDDGVGCDCDDQSEEISDLEDEVEDLKRELAEFRNIEALRRSHAEWSQETFGSVSAIGPAKHLAKEALEVAEDPHNVIEHADCWMLLWDMQRRAGITDKQLATAIYQKLIANKHRKWPAPLEGEAREHDRSAEASK